MQIRRKHPKDPGNRLMPDLPAILVDEESLSCYLQKIHPYEKCGWTAYSKADYELIPEECWEDVTARIKEVHLLDVSRTGHEIKRNELWCDSDKVAILICGKKYRLVRALRNWCNGDVMYKVERKVSP